MEFWKSIEDKYKFLKVADESQENCDISAPRTTTVDPQNRKQYEWNARAKKAISCRLADAKFTNIMQCTTIKEVWDKLRSIYEGNYKVRKTKLQTLSAQFETHKVKEEEDDASYFMRGLDTELHTKSWGYG